LSDHFMLFRQRYLAGKPHHPAHLTAEEVESV
ncbi:MAG: DTW domain-containing protein, partial [Mixta calida]|nr:DTW domain-containing protein [Mixta calida]